MNLYTYCENDPIDGYDPDGHQWVASVDGSGGKTKKNTKESKSSNKGSGKASQNKDKPSPSATSAKSNSGSKSNDIVKTAVNVFNAIITAAADVSDRITYPISHPVEAITGTIKTLSDFYTATMNRYKNYVVDPVGQFNKDTKFVKTLSSKAWGTIKTNIIDGDAFTRTRAISNVGFELITFFSPTKLSEGAGTVAELGKLGRLKKIINVAGISGEFKFGAAVYRVESVGVKFDEVASKLKNIKSNVQDLITAKLNSLKGVLANYDPRNIKIQIVQGANGEKFGVQVGYVDKKGNFKLIEEPNNVTKGAAESNVNKVITQLESSNIYSTIEYEGTVKVGGKTVDVSRRVYQRSDIDWDMIDPKTGLTNLQRALKGKPPIGSDGKPIELHHLTGTEPGSMVEIEATTHDNFSKQLHGLIEDGRSFRNNQDLEKQYNNFRYNYWIWRAKQVSGK